MILIDTGALYALMDKNDINHSSAKRFYETLAGRDTLSISVPILTEAYLLIDARLGTYFANRLWQSAIEGVFEILELNKNDIRRAFEIERKYQKAGFGFVDSTCFSLCERYRIRKVFTYDRKHFGLYRPTFSRSLDILPGSIYINING